MERVMSWARGFKALDELSTESWSGRRTALAAQPFGEAAVDLPGPRRAAVDQAGVRLDERRAGLEAFPRLVGGLDAADRDEHEPGAGPFPQAFGDPRRGALWRGAGAVPTPRGRSRCRRRR